MSFPAIENAIFSVQLFAPDIADFVFVMWVCNQKKIAEKFPVELYSNPPEIKTQQTTKTHLSINLNHPLSKEKNDYGFVQNSNSNHEKVMWWEKGAKTQKKKRCKYLWNVKTCMKNKEVLEREFSSKQFVPQQKFIGITWI